MRNVYIISHTHWDREWYRPFQLFRLKLIHLIDGVLKLLDDDPQFKYFMLDGQTIVLDDYLAMRPEKEATLRQHIQKGRIIIGPWHILPDTFLVGPESHIRNLLQGDRTAAHFGRKMMIGYLPDPFGHPGQMPQILQGFDIETSCLWRGLDEQPAEFWWQSPDGSRVFMAYLRDSYSNGASLPANNLPDFAAAVAREADKLSPHSAVSDFLIMYGTDHMEPSPKTSRAIAYADQNLADTRVLHSTLPNFVEAVHADVKGKKVTLPVVIGELRQCRRMHLLPGVLSTRMWIKQRNHSSENLLLKWTEPFSTFATLIATNKQSPSTLEHPAELIRKTWRMLMENHPHDSICGCSIDQVHEEMMVRFDQVDQVGEELTIQSLESLAANVHTDSDLGESALVIFNPLSNSRSDVVYATLELPANVNEFALVDENGVSLAYQTRGRGSHELINVAMSVKEFQTGFGFVHDGRAASMTVQGLSIRREGNEVFIEAIVAEGGEPNMDAWKAGRAQANRLLADPTVTAYHVRALSAEAANVIFKVDDVPGLGHKTLWVRRRPEAVQTVRKLNPLARALLPLIRLPFIQKWASRKRTSWPPFVIENDHFAVEAHQDGTLSVLDKQAGIAYSGLNCFQDGGDCGDEYNYSPPPRDRIYSSHLKSACLVRGIVQQRLELDLELVIPDKLAADRQSRSSKRITVPIKSIVSLTNGVPRIDIRTIVNNTARDHRLRVHFPAPFGVETGYEDGHFEVVERKLGLPTSDDTWIEQPRPEVPQRAFTDITDGKSGLMVANRGLPEVEVLKNAAGNGEIALTLLRCIGWLSRDDFSTRKGHAGPAMETPAAQMPGEWTFDYSIIPHSGNWQQAFEQAYAFETPMRAVNAGLHEGKLLPSGAFIKVEPASFVLSTVKQSEDLRGWLVRGYNLTSEEMEVSLKPWIPYKHVEQINLVERKLSSIKPAQDGSISLKVRGHEIATVLFKTV